MIDEPRMGKNIQPKLPALLRQSVYGRPAEYEDTIDAEWVREWLPRSNGILGNCFPESAFMNFNAHMVNLGLNQVSKNERVIKI